MITFYSNNLVDQATITATHSNSLYPTSNLKDPRRTKVVRTTTNSDSVVFNFGSQKPINSFIIVDNKLTGFGVSSITLELNNYDSWTSHAISIPVTLNSSFGFGYAEFSSVNYQYARVVMNSSNSFCELSKVFIGEKIAFENGMGIDLGWSFQDKELSSIKENRYGQKFIDTIMRQRQMEFSLRSMDKTELDQVLEIYDSKSNTSPFYLRIGDTSMINDPARFAGMFYLNSVPRITNKSFGLYDLSMSIEEAT